MWPLHHAAEHLGRNASNIVYITIRQCDNMARLRSSITQTRSGVRTVVAELGSHDGPDILKGGRFATYLFQLSDSNLLSRVFIQLPLCSAEQPDASSRQFVDRWQQFIQTYRYQKTLWKQQLDTRKAFRASPRRYSRRSATIITDGCCLAKFGGASQSYEGGASLNGASDIPGHTHQHIAACALCMHCS